ncbi:APC family permease [Moraxella sp. FZLJ2107]|uniref:APC family permease n=1 Tax=unclassified Moraxella TaxID=2685852 RepID=UPI0020C8CBD9|nr:MULTISPECIES: APC family permease [unclassified Moraxella]UTO05987.1 APC family permease [Moraxella sp. FZLJ2107]UTO22723.1 APC family permease [Moraxella sp. FZLJ2109]
MNTSPTPNIAKLKRNLGLWHVIIIGLAYIQPMTLFDTFGMVSRDSGGHVPMSYLFALIAILLTSISYGHMIRAYPSSGSAYTYTQKAINPSMGFMVGWSSWLDYLLSPMVNIILAVLYLEALFPSVNHWVWVIGLTALMTGVNIFGSKVVAYFNSWIVLVQVLVIAVFTYLIYSKLSIGVHADGTLAENAYELWSLKPFWDEMTSVGALITGATILCFSFTGFDSISSLAEETKDVKNTLPKAMIWTTLIAGIIFIISAYFMQTFLPSDPSIYFEAVDETQAEILLLVGGSAFQAAVLGFAIVTVMASGISAHAGVSRLMYVMGRDGVISKKIFGQISPRFFTPVNNVLIAGAIALTAGFISLETVVNLISFGALTAFSFVNLSVIFRYAIRDKRVNNFKEIFSYVIVPALGFIAIFLMWLEVDSTTFSVGLFWAALGFVWLGVKTRGFKAPVPQYREEDV